MYGLDTMTAPLWVAADSCNHPEYKGELAAHLDSCAPGERRGLLRLFLLLKLQEKQPKNPAA